MKVLEKDLKRGIVKVRVEDEDDLWLLKTIVKEGDVVIAHTMRDVKVDGEGKRRLPMKLALQVKNVYFQPFSSRLRIHGIIVEGPEEYGLRGSHHTFNIDVGCEVEIVKKSWTPSELKRLERSVVKGLKALLVAFDFDEISIALLYDQGIKYLIDKSLPTLNKDSGSMDELINTISEIVSKVLSTVKCDVVIVASPAFMKDLITVRLGKNVKVFKDSVSNGGRAGIEELIRRDSVKKLLKEVNIIESEKVFEEFMELLVSRPQRIAYGIDEVKLAAVSNAIAKLLVLEDL
ncbi:MAG: mRNA surveillance protein Pelota, partial [Sulfolobales archaeon]